MSPEVEEYLGDLLVLLDGILERRREERLALMAWLDLSASPPQARMLPDENAHESTP